MVPPTAGEISASAMCMIQSPFQLRKTIHCFAPPHKKTMKEPHIESKPSWLIVLLGIGFSGVNGGLHARRLNFS
jgi:hypothetical protein